MSIHQQLPWILVAVATLASAASWMRPMPTPEAAIVSTFQPERAVMPAQRHATSGLDERTLRRVIREVIREEADAAVPPEAPSQRPAPQLKTPDQIAGAEEGALLVQDLIEDGYADQRDVLALRQVLGQVDREDGERILSTWFTALNHGDVTVDGPPI